MFLAKGIIRGCELDNYEDGCQPDTGYLIDWGIEFQANTINDLLQKIKEYHNVDDDALWIETNRIFVQVHEMPLYDRWITPTESDIEAWKRKERELYLVNYSYKIFNEL